MSEIARELDTPESTLRSWRDRFRPFMPTKEVTEGIGRDGQPLVITLYSLDRYRTFHHLVTKWAKESPTKSLREVGNELARRFPIDARAEPSQSGEAPVPLELEQTVPSAPPTGRGPHPELGDQIAQLEVAVTRLSALGDPLQSDLVMIKETVETLHELAVVLSEVKSCCDQQLAAQSAATEAQLQSAASTEALVAELKLSRDQQRQVSGGWWRSLFEGWSRLGGRWGWHTAILLLVLGGIISDVGDAAGAAHSIARQTAQAGATTDAIDHHDAR